MQTARYIADSHDLEIIPLEDVGEVRYGKWEGKKIKEVAKKRLWRTVQFFPSRLRFPQGEALREVQFRAVQALERVTLQHDKEIIVVVSHADVIKLVLAHYLGIHIDLFQRIVISPASASVVSLMADGAVRVLRVNDDGPLQPPQAPQTKAKAKEEKKKKSARLHGTEVQAEKNSADGATTNGIVADEIMGEKITTQAGTVEDKP
jgi:probable phosphoglycerate mutase